MGEKNEELEDKTKNYFQFTGKVDPARQT